MLGSIISAGADLAGGLLNQNAAKEASKTDWKRTQKVLQNQIQWRVDDAVKAGLHPLVGAGISPSSGPPPSTVGDMGSSVSSMGNNLGRAVDAYMDPAAKVAAKAALLDLEQRQANIDLTKAQLAGAQKALLTTGSTPGIASPIPVSPSSRKGDKLGGGQVIGRGFDGQAFTVPGGWNAEQYEQEFGELNSEIQGNLRLAEIARRKAAQDMGYNFGDTAAGQIWDWLWR